MKGVCCKRAQAARFGTSNNSLIGPFEPLRVRGGRALGLISLYVWSFLTPYMLVTKTVSNCSANRLIGLTFQFNVP